MTTRLSERRPISKQVKKKRAKKGDKPKKVEYPEALDFDKIKLVQTDLWFMHRYFFGEDTRLPKSELLPKFAAFFNKKLDK